MFNVDACIAKQIGLEGADTYFMWPVLNECHSTSLGKVEVVWGT
jgi:hypothetical protein